MTAAAPMPQGLDPDPPAEPVKLIFIHHSTGENWLADGYGELGRELGRNNYFVSDTNYGWGPNYIGDRTDIPDWIEWFRSSDTGTYMQALFSESGQHSGFTRTLSDPGGENQIIMFKSCFPNSELSGNPDDPTGSYADLSVAGAKYVYSELLRYFSTRPDKLFVVVTAPPVSNRSNAKNARAFNMWLMNDWLGENNYTLNNVAIFDFYNVLTGSNAHHQFQNGRIEHETGRKDTLNYPTGDDHPSEKGSQKATDEFIPLLNIFYNSWVKDAPLEPPAVISAPEEEPLADTQEEAPAEPGSQAPASAPPTTLVIDDFEAAAPPGTNGWEMFQDEATPTTINCVPQNEIVHSGGQAMLLDFDVAGNAWASCSLMYDTPQNWSESAGVIFYLQSAASGLVFDVNLHSGSADAFETYQYTIETQPDWGGGWVPISLDWDSFHRVEWEEGAGEPFNKANAVTGFAFGFSTFPDTPNTGMIWVDDISLFGQNGAPDTTPVIEVAPPVVEEQEDTEPSSGFKLPCAAAFALPMMLVGTGLLNRKKIF